MHWRRAQAAVKIIMENKPETIGWKAPEFEYREKTADWFWIVGIATIALIVLAFIFENILLGILAALGGFSVSLYGAKKPKMVSIKIGPKGIQIGDRMFDYENLESFWINYDPPQKKELIVKSKKTFMPHIKIMLQDENPKKIRDFLLGFMNEEKIDESLTTTIMNIIGF